MKIFEIEIESITPYAKNPRRNDAAVDRVARSISEFGWQQPIVIDTEMVVIVGHTRLKAAQQLGLPTVPVTIAEHLSPSQAQAYRIADNRVADLADWDWPLLADEIAQLQASGFDATILGWDQGEIDAMMDSDFTPPADDGSAPLDVGSTTHEVKFADDQWTTIERAIDRVRSEQDVPDMPTAAALELVCADYLA